MKNFLFRFGYTVAALGTGTFLNACEGPDAQSETSSSALATATFALVSVPKDVSCLRTKAKGATRSVTRDQDVTPGKVSTFSVAGLPSGSVAFDMDAFSVPCAKVAAGQVPAWVADSQVVFLANGTSTPVSVILRRNAQANVTADFVDDNVPPPPPPPSSGLQFNPAVFDFGAVAVGSSVTADFKLFNSSGAATGPISVSFPRPDADLSINAMDCAKPLPANIGCLVRVTFSPKMARMFRNDLTATSGMLKSTAAIMGIAVQSPPPPPPRLIGHWAFNPTQGSVVADSSGNGNTGEIVQGVMPNSPPVSGVFVPGKVASALDLSPTNSWVRVKRSASIDSLGTTGAFTASGWIKTGALPSPDRSNSIISRNEVGTSFEHFGLSLNGGKPSATVHFFFATAAEPAALGQWTHLAAVYDGITLNVYSNGVLVTSMDIGWPIAADTTDVVIGARQSIDTIKDFFAGSVDEVRLYNEALTSAEISALMTSM